MKHPKHAQGSEAYEQEHTKDKYLYTPFESGALWKNAHKEATLCVRGRPGNPQWLMPDVREIRGSHQLFRPLLRKVGEVERLPLQKVGGKVGTDWKGKRAIQGVGMWGRWEAIRLVSRWVDEKRSSESFVAGPGLDAYRVGFGKTV
eukprot:6204017-Pleurochrysis_carterae.AAC.2